MNLAPNGKPSKLTPEQYKLVRSDAFIAWFGDWLKAYETENYDNVSKVIDENGEPLVVYHGTLEKFNVFNTYFDNGTWHGKGAYFTSSLKDLKTNYVTTKDDIYLECFLDIKNPIIVGKKYESTYFEKKYREIILQKLRYYRFPRVNYAYENSYDSDTLEKIVREEFNESKSGELLNSIYRELNFSGIIFLSPHKLKGHTAPLKTKHFVAFNPTQIKLANGTNTTFDSSNPDIRFDYGGNVLTDKMPTFIAPNGNRSNLIGIKAEDENGKWVYLYDLVRSKKFKEFFGDWEEAYITKDYDYVSKIIDENGEPNICYHTTSNEFFEFSENFIGSRTDAGYYGKGFYFTEGTPDSHYGEREIPCFLNIRNPYLKQSSYKNYELNTDDLKSKGFDGVIVFSDIENIDLTKGLGYRGNRVEEIVAYYPEQIKLADATNTTFDRYDSDIRYKKGGIMSKHNIQVVIPNKTQYDKLYSIVTNELGYVGEPRLVLLENEKVIGGIFLEPPVSYTLDGKKYINPLYEYKFDIFIVKSKRKKGYSKLLLDEMIKDFINNFPNADQIRGEVVNKKLEKSLEKHYGFSCDSGNDEGITYCYLSKNEAKKLLNKKITFKKGGSLSKTPAPKNERIYGSKVNKPKSSSSKSKASSIILSPKVIKSINSILEKHNEKSKKKIPLATAKAVVRRGMGAYSSTHRPTISGGKPNSRVAWGLARLNAFVFKIQKGYSKSGKYIQDDDLINELGYRVKKYENGGTTDYKYFVVTKNEKEIFVVRFLNTDDRTSDMIEMIDKLTDRGYILKEITKDKYENFDSTKVSKEDISEFMSGTDYYESGGNVSGCLSVNELEKLLGRKINIFNENIVNVNGILYQKVFLKPEYKRISF